MENNNIRVISAFAGLGKTTVGNKYENVLDLQSSPYRYDYSKIKKKDYEKMKYNRDVVVNPNWPQNYIDEIFHSLSKYDLILVPSNEDIRELLVNNHINFLFILPEYDMREELLNRYKERGNNDILINGVMDYFDNWSREQKDYSYPIKLIKSGQYLEDFLKENNYLK